MERIDAISRYPGVLHAEVVAASGPGNAYSERCREIWQLAAQRAGDAPLEAIEVRTTAGLLVLVRCDDHLATALATTEAVASVLRYELGRLDA